MCKINRDLIANKCFFHRTAGVKADPIVAQQDVSTHSPWFPCLSSMLGWQDFFQLPGWRVLEGPPQSEATTWAFQCTNQESPFMPETEGKRRSSEDPCRALYCPTPGTVEQFIKSSRGLLCPPLFGDGYRMAGTEGVSNGFISMVESYF
ncbi:hypothetical protein CEXT_15131 [Caerostris extrusa]|uniref:Uncharacterized protein n=1 Tax=Caerostris extrusa TaxID=172846 RepID=A0AAV4MDR7_CAEEX|nr:hypothetical protein CEXT_15131 [Caerostris extrusa]